ncbi:MAG: PTS sugar transporter subunit IIA [Cetobacterium sp.]
MKNYHVILASHGDMSKEVKKSLEMVIGDVENVSTASLYPGMDLEDFKNIILDIIKNLNADLEKIIIVCDILGGTPNNSAVSIFLENSKVSVITSFNMAILIGILDLDVIETSDLSSVVEEAKESIKLFSK